MNNGRIYDIVLTVLKKEGKGNIVKPDRFTYLLQQCHLEYYNQQYDKWAGSQTIIDSLQSFVTECAIDLAFPVLLSSLKDSFDVSVTYRHFVAMRTSTAATAKHFDLLTPQEWTHYMGDAVMKGSADYPVASIFDGYIYGDLGSAASQSAVIVFLRDAYNDPYFDYYLDASYNVKYLTVDQEYTLQAGETYRDGTTSGAKTSQSEELEWGDQDKVNIISLLLEKLGVSMQAPDIAQYAMGKQQQQNIM